MGYAFCGDNKIITTRKAHDCHWCGGDIPAKTQCRVVSGIFEDSDDSISRIWFHVECGCAWQELDHDDFYESWQMGRGCWCHINERDDAPGEHAATCDRVQRLEHFNYLHDDYLHNLTIWRRD